MYALPGSRTLPTILYTYRAPRYQSTTIITVIGKLHVVPPAKVVWYHHLLLIPAAATPTI